jgi:hypothetical protein
VSEPATDNPARPFEATESFGQAGVRQHLGLVVNAICIAGMVIASFMWYRSVDRADLMDYRGGQREMSVISAMGRLKITSVIYDQPVNNNAGWIYRSRHTRSLQDGWKPSIYKTIGIEFSNRPENGGAGFWLRINWYLIVIACGLVPAISLLRHWRRTREE